MFNIASEVDQKLDFLKKLFHCAEKLSYWMFNNEGDLLETNCNDLVHETVFRRSGCKKDMLEYSNSHTEPMLLSAAPGVMWGAAFEQENGKVSRIHVIGPVLNMEISLNSIEQSLRGSDLALSWKNDFIKKLQMLPVISTINFFPYILMLHCCISGENLSRSDIRFQQGEGTILKSTTSTQKKDRHLTWMAEQALLRMVRDGDLNFKEALSRAGSLSNGVGVTLGDSLLHAKISSSSFITLCIRAAIEGGLSPEFAYTRGDAYTQSMLECKTPAEIARINHIMYEDFIKSVHKCRTNPNVSKQIQACCDYIEMHTNEKLTLADLSQRVGYTEYYLSRKFKAETGVSINDYIKYTKIERSKLLLTTSTQTIQSISDTLQFCSRSYFSDVFLNITGMSPAEFRESHQKL